MRGKVAKTLRKQVYGDHSLRTKRYVRDLNTGAIRNVGLRAVYRKTKKGRRDWKAVTEKFSEKVG